MCRMTAKHPAQNHLSSGPTNLQPNKLQRGLSLDKNNVEAALAAVRLRGITVSSAARAREIDMLSTMRADSPKIHLERSDAPAKHKPQAQSVSRPRLHSADTGSRQDVTGIVVHVMSSLQCDRSSRYIDITVRIDSISFVHLFV